VQKSVHRNNHRPPDPVTGRHDAQAQLRDQEALGRLGAEIRGAAFELALECVQEGLRDDVVPSLSRLGQLGQLGNLPTLIAELGRGLTDPVPGRLRRGSPLAARVRDHAREREALGFAPREVVTELLLLRRVLWRFVTQSGASVETGAGILAEPGLADTVDRLLIECVLAYFDRATSELASQARSDPLTGLLNHQAFTTALELELERARRYDRGLSLVFFDVDRFKTINDTLGHPEGDRVLRLLAGLLRESLRTTDLAGRMGGDEFAACLLETDPETAGRFLSRLSDRIDELSASGDLPDRFRISPGVAHFPTEADDADGLFRLADERLYLSKRGAE
jgi:diguanylate cyclase (GGDEF)-like protein